VCLCPPYRGHSEHTPRPRVVGGVLTHGLCDYCARTKKLDQAGLVVTHYVAIPVSAKAIHAVGSGRVRRRCGGSGRPPRERARP
jgi:hypothetical protein